MNDFWDHTVYPLVIDSAGHNLIYHPDVLDEETFKEYMWKLSMAGAFVASRCDAAPA